MKPVYDMNVGLKRAITKAYKDSAQGQVEAALADIRRWQRKSTIANNKLADARDRLVRLTQALAAELDGKKQETATDASHA